jgi:hypothetical protein
MIQLIASTTNETGVIVAYQLDYNVTERASRSPTSEFA